MGNGMDGTGVANCDPSKCPSSVVVEADGVPHPLLNDLSTKSNLIRHDDDHIRDWHGFGLMLLVHFMLRIGRMSWGVNAANV
ncbi:MAG: hypothetical protein EBT04_10870 [Betaproteobacteria bacterium]|jgi:hypothetical protein|nr:hypothetical protein [Betaproteobacteria bacterium]